MGRLALAAALAGLLVLPATAPAGGEPRSYRGTLVLDQTPVRSELPTGESSASYSFHARYKVSGKRGRPFIRGSGYQYLLTGRGNQAFAFKMDMHDTADPNNTRHEAENWHGSGVWPKSNGNIAFLNQRGRHFSVTLDLGNSGRPATIPLSVHREASTFHSEPEFSCTGRWGQDGQRVYATSECAFSPGEGTVPVATAINPHALLYDQDGSFSICPGLRGSVRDYHGFCGTASRGGRLKATYHHVIGPPLDYPFWPFADEAKARDFEIDSGIGVGATNMWGSIVLRTTIKLDLRAP
jgi:hypothetical protein